MRWTRVGSSGGLRPARALFGLAWLYGAAAQAVEYSLAGNLALGQQYNSNFLLAPVPQAVWGGNLDLGGTFKAAEPRWEIAANPRLSNYFYTPAGDLQLQNQYVDARAHYHTERFRYALSGNFTDDYLLSSQSDPVVGLVLGKVHRNLKGIAPSWSYSFSETTRGTLGYDYERAEYAADSYPDSESHGVFAALERQYSERLGLEGRLAYNRFDASQPAGYKNAIESVNFSLGFEYAFDESLDIRFSAGAQHNQTQAEYQGYAIQGYALIDQNPIRYAPVLVPAQIQAPPRRSLSPVFSLSLAKHLENTDWQLSYDRQISPSINGALLEYDRLGLAATRRFREDLDGSVELGYTRQSYTVAVGGNSGLSYYQAAARLSYRWSERWSATAAYRYLLRALDKADNQDAHVVSLTLRYDFDTHSF